MTGPVVSLDPDGITPCYSDHEHDIKTFGCCTMCGSVEVNVVGHILPGVKRHYGMDPVAAAELVLGDMACRLFDGVLLDTFSASAIVAVDKALGAPGKARLRQMTLVRAADVCFKLLNRAGGS